MAKSNLWERPKRADEHPPVVEEPSDYLHALPRLLHRDGEHKRVDTQEECEAAQKDGWTLLPIVKIDG